MDVSQAPNSPMIGVKLDKSKAFDRVIPNVVGALLLAFGAPKHFVNFFLKIYQGLHRHLAYRGWIKSVATTAANGVAQGCSLSLLAANSYNKVWFHLLEHLPEIAARAFVDDSYLWCQLIHVSLLEKQSRSQNYGISWLARSLILPNLRCGPLISLAAKTCAVFSLNFLLSLKLKSLVPKCTQVNVRVLVLILAS